MLKKNKGTIIYYLICTLIVAAIVGLPTAFVWWVAGKEAVKWLFIGVGGMLAAMFGYWGAVAALRRALIFLGMKPETADREYGGFYYPWRR